MVLKLNNVTSILTVDEFKQYFTEFPYQPYPTWVKTVWDIDEYAKYSDLLFYKSLINLNATVPTATANWACVSPLWNSADTFNANTYCMYAGAYYKALVQNTNEQPDVSTSWVVLSDSDVLAAFPNARVWAAPISYAENDKVIYYNSAYKQVVRVSSEDNNYTNPSSSSWATSTEDDPAEWFTDKSIERSMGEANFKFNLGMFPGEKGVIIASYLTAFFLLYDRNLELNAMSPQSSTSGPVRFRAAGKMQVSYMESKLFAKFPSYEFLSYNDYGKKAFNLMLPYLRGGVFAIDGAAGPY